MIFNTHSELQGSHAFLSPSSPHWVNYSDEKLDDRFLTAMAAARGTELHAFAEQAIKLGIRLRGNGQTISQYVNDAIGFKMNPEQMLFYSVNAFGTADAIKFQKATRGKKPLLRIHDLKTGKTPSNMKQLEVYCALFCLEYGFKPFELDYELRIYQNDEVIVHIPELEDLVHIMDRIITFDRRLTELRAEVTI